MDLLACVRDIYGCKVNSLAVIEGMLFILGALVILWATITVIREIKSEGRQGEASKQLYKVATICFAISIGLFLLEAVNTIILQSPRESINVFLGLFDKNLKLPTE